MAAKLTRAFGKGIQRRFTIVFLLLAFVPIAVMFVTLRFHKDALYADYKARVLERHGALNDYLETSTAQLALKNLHSSGPPQPTHPFELNVFMVSIDEPRHAMDTVTQANCPFSYAEDQAELCFGVGDLASAGAYLYVTGYFTVSGVVPHKQGQPTDASTRMQMELSARGSTLRWIGVFQDDPKRPNHDRSRYLRFRVTGYRANADWSLPSPASYDKGFGGALISPDRKANCDSETCSGRWYYTFRVPLDMFRADIQGDGAQWPAADIGSMTARLRIFGPGNSATAGFFDSSMQNAFRKNSIDEKLRWYTEPGESLKLVLGDAPAGQTLWQLDAGNNSKDRPWDLGHWLAQFVPVELTPQIVGDHDIPGLGKLKVMLTPKRSAFDDYLAPVVAWYAYMAIASFALVVMCYFFLNFVVIQRIQQLTGHAQSLSESLDTTTKIDTIDQSFSLLGFKDELGVLANTLDQVLKRLSAEYHLRQGRLIQMQTQWRAIGHEINSPLQSLDVLIGEDDPARRHVNRMKIAVKTFRSAANIQADLAKDIALESIDVAEFLVELCASFKEAGHAQVRYLGSASGVRILAHGDYLESALDNVLQNAKRFAPEGTNIDVNLRSEPDGNARITVTNYGPPIPEDMKGKIFDLGVSADKSETETSEHSGLGLYVSLLYVTAMNGTISADNLPDNRGVEFVVTFPIARSPQPVA